MYLCQRYISITLHTMNFEHYHAAVRYLEGLSNLASPDDYTKDRKDPARYIARMKFFLKLLGNPEKGFKYVHVTGTSGKGTVSTMIHNAFVASGKRVALYTSPFVTTTIEKIKFGSEYISPGEFAEIVDELKPFIDRAHVESPLGRPSYFEIIFAIVLLYAKRKKSEWVVLEVGCGGRYDATNVIPCPEAAVITNVDLDHIEILGDTVEKIAYEKAGIIKKGSVVFTTELKPLVRQILRAEARKVGASYNEIEDGATYEQKNKLLAVSVCRTLGLPQREAMVAIQKTRLPARFEIMQKQPLVIIDGAHNSAKIKTTVENLKKLKYKKLYAIVGCAGNKSHREILKHIVGVSDEIYFTKYTMKERRAADPELLAKDAKEIKPTISSSVFLDPGRALRLALLKARKQDVILVVGSFFLAGDLRRWWVPEFSILKKRMS